jgi:hypothetical protein
VKRIDGSSLMLREYSTRALIELLQIGKTPSGPDPVLQHAPEALKRIAVVATRGRQERPPQLLGPVGQRRRELVRPMAAPAVGHPDHLFAGVATEGHHWMDGLAPPLCLKLGAYLREDFGRPLRDRADDPAPHPAGDTAPGARAEPRVAVEALVAVDLALAQGTGRQASPLGCAPPARPGQGKTPEAGFIFLQQTALTPASPIGEGSECGSCTSCLRIIPLASKAGKMPPSSPVLEGAMPWSRLFFTTNSPYAFSCGSSSCGTSLGPSQVCLLHPCRRSPSATAPMRPKRLRA